MYLNMYELLTASELGLQAGERLALASAAMRERVVDAPPVITRAPLKFEPRLGPLPGAAHLACQRATCTWAQAIVVS